MAILRMMPVLLILGLGLTLPNAWAMKQIFGVNVGGSEYTTAGGVYLMADPYQEDRWYSDADFGICAPDNVVYAKCRYTYDSMGYRVPLDGDGRYALGLGFSDEPSPHERSCFDVYVNGQLILEKFDMVEKCGAYKTCNQVFYFDVCNGRMLLNGEKSKVYNDELLVEFVAAGSYAVADAIFVMKDTCDGVQNKVFTDGTNICFDQEPKFSCDKP
jgi:Malectin domain